MARLRPLSASDVPAVRQWWREHWGGDTMIAHGEVFHPEALEGFAAEEGGRWVGLITCRLGQGECEITSLDSLQERQGTGTRLMQAVIQKAREAGCRRVRLTTTNDNLNALGFYQKRGFALLALRQGAVDETRKVKPAIPLIGQNGIPLRDELELELLL